MLSERIPGLGGLGSAQKGQCALCRAFAQLRERHHVERFHIVRSVLEHALVQALGFEEPPLAQELAGFRR